MDFNLKCGLTVISWPALFFVLKNATKKTGTKCSGLYI